MTWKELKKMIDDGLKESDMDDTAELDYIDIERVLYTDPEFCPDKDNNTFSVF